MAKNPAAVRLGRRGGQAISKAKSDAARENGAKGGRPHTAFREDCDCASCSRIRARRRSR